MMDAEDTKMAVPPPSGAQFHRCALQVNPHHYSGTFRGQSNNGDSAEYARAIIEKAFAIGVSALAITDHNSVEDVPMFQDAAKPYGIHVFPGFEVSSREGVHVLCIYPESETSERLGRYLGGFGILDTEPSSSLANDSFGEIIRKVKEQGGIAIAAHATSNKGLLKELHGHAATRPWRNDDLLAVQIPGPISDLPHNFRQIVENKNADYRRARNAGDDLALAVINAKDIAKPEDLDDPTSTCWIKMSDISIEGLRQAFLDPDSRIRLNSDQEPDKHAEIIGIEWEGGFLDGASIRFNSNLNVMVGGRGTGKSTVIESLRYALGMQPIGEDAQKAHSGVVQQVLRAGTKISLEVRSQHPTERIYSIERIVPNPPVVREESGQISNLLPREILPSVEIYGQHEISGLARSPEKRTSLLDRFAQPDEGLERRKASVLRGLEQTRRALIDARYELQQIDEQLAKLPGLEETLAHYQEAGLEGRLSEQSMLVREEGILEAIQDRLQGFRENLTVLRQELPIDRTFLSANALEGLSGRDILAEGNEVLERLSEDVEKASNLLDEALVAADNGFVDIKEKWNERKREVEVEYQKILRELQKSAVDGEEFMRLRRQVESLRPLRDRHALLEKLELEHHQRRTALLVEWEEIKAARFQTLAKAAKKVSKSLRNRVQVKVTASGNREPFFEAIRNGVGGRLSEAITLMQQAESFSLPEFVKCCREGVAAVQKSYQIPQTQAQRLADATPDVLMKIEELELPATTEISLNTASIGDSPNWQPLDSLSTGQKATAVLLLLLLESDAPLIVDQPEDDLDNRFITEGIVPKMREEKLRRQFIFSTHNANIPVLGDAELILGLSASGSVESAQGLARISTELMGSIDAPSVREFVEEILEGGKAAFETRRRKYGF